MTVAELLEKIDCDPMLKTMARTAVRTFAPALLTQKVRLVIDPAAERLNLKVGDLVVLDTTFREAVDYVETPVDV